MVHVVWSLRTFVGILKAEMGERPCLVEEQGGQTPQAKVPTLWSVKYFKGGH